ncbi:f-box domain-containing protein [Gigaspora margarita]|uniref:F-box domain-containing protein n=1 Tax=Gigaspora margarita TaxID=4874 RepID=A0A8H3X0C8_GIGMA|nr:f-box domain-containing protein [Gigaspora margarita]
MVNIFRKVFRRLAKICKKRRQKERSIPIETKPVLSNECIQHVFKFIGDKDLYSCLFVNKYWSRNVIPILWSQPFQNLSPKYQSKLLPIYLACLTEEEKIALKKIFGKIKIKIKIPKYRLTYNYETYLQELSFKDLESAVFSWLSTSFRKPIKDTYSLNEQIEQLTTLLCTLFFRSSRNLNSFIIDKFLPFTNIPEVTIFSESGILARLRKLSINFRKLSSIIDLLETLYMNCKNLEYLEINFIEFENEEIIFNSITKLINQQEKLKELRLGNIQSNNGTRNILTSIKSQMNSIETIHLNSINFKGISLKILGKCSNLKKLVFWNSQGLGIQNAKSLQDSKYQIEKLHLWGQRKQSNITAIIIQSIGKNIQQLWVDIISPEIVQTIIDNCPQLIDLRIMDYQPKQVPFLLNLLQDFNQLEKLTITRETVVEMGVVNFSGKNIPINLKYLRLECGFTTGQLEKLLTTCEAPLKTLIVEYCKFEFAHLKVIADYIKTTKSLKVLGIGGKKEYSRRELREIESLEQNYGIYVIPLHEVHDW